MKSSKRCELGPMVACMLVSAACNNAAVPVETAGAGGSPQKTTPVSGTGAGTTGSAGTTSSAAGVSAAGQSAAGTGSAGMAGGAAPQVQAIAMIHPLPGASGSAGAAGGAAGSAAGAAGMSAAAGSGTAGTSASAGLQGTATFTKTRSGVDLAIMVSGCTDGKSYPVHIHEGMSCDNAMTQGGHWGAMPMSGSAGAGGAAAGSGGAAGNSAAAGSGGAAGSGAAAAGSGGAAGGPPPLVLRGEDIPDIKCSAGMGSTVTSRSTPDVRLLWTVGGDTLTNVVGHVIVVHDGSARIACGKIEMK